MPQFSTINAFIFPKWAQTVANGKCVQSVDKFRHVDASFLCGLSPYLRDTIRKHNVHNGVFSLVLLCVSLPCALLIALDTYISCHIYRSDSSYCVNLCVW